MTLSSNTIRIRGRKGAELRKRRLQADDYMCRLCKEQGILRPATEVDHIKSLASGGLEVDDNCQALCGPHHAAKTEAEGGYGLVASTHPDWLRRSAIPIEIICGPPAAGKTTYAREHASPADTVIDLDEITKDIDPSFTQAKGRDKATLVSALRRRNEILGQLDRKRQGKAWFIVAAPTKAERQWWQTKLGGTVTVLNPGLSECLKRSKARGTGTRGIEQWFKASVEPWRKQRRASEGWD